MGSTNNDGCSRAALISLPCSQRCDPTVHIAPGTQRHGFDPGRGIAFLHCGGLVQSSGFHRATAGHGRVPTWALVLGRASTADLVHHVTYRIDPLHRRDRPPDVCQDPLCVLLETDTATPQLGGKPSLTHFERCIALSLERLSHPNFHKPLTSTVSRDKKRSTQSKAGTGKPSLVVTAGARRHFARYNREPSFASFHETKQMRNASPRGSSEVKRVGSINRIRKVMTFRRPFNDSRRGHRTLEK
jgi:hypothetical protein